MKKMLSLVLVSVLGGAITLGTYKTFIEKEQKIVVETPNTQTNIIPATYKTANTNLAAVEGIDFTTAAEKTLDAVVHVKSVTINSKQPTLQDLFMGRVPERRQLGTGSGVIITPDGYIITNNHVIDGSTKLSVTLNNNKTVEAKIIGTDPKTDIALLKIENENDLPYATFGDSDSVRIGEWVLAVGNPFNLTSTVTAGIVSAKSRDLTGRSTQSFIQTDAAVNPGNSGGALVNTNGELVGINTAITSQTGSYIGYSFAVPSNIARKVIEDIMEFGNVQNGILGIKGGSLNSGYAEKLGIAETEGVYVDDVEEDTGAYQAGLKSGDIIIKVDDIEIKKFSDLTGYIGSKRLNDVVNVNVLRNGFLKEIPVTLLKINTVTLPILGELKEANKKDLKRYKLDYGLKINSITIDRDYANYWRKNRINPGDILIAINNTKVKSTDDIKNILTNLNSDVLSLTIMTSSGQTERHSFKL